MSQDNSMVSTITEQKEMLKVVLSSRTIHEIAASMRLSVSTVRRWLSTRENQEAVALILHPVMLDLSAQAVGAMPDALQVLIDISQSNESTVSQKIQASKEIMRFGLQLWETVTLSTKLGVLEQSMGINEYE